MICTVCTTTMIWNHNPTQPLDQSPARISYLENTREFFMNFTSRGKKWKEFFFIGSKSDHWECLSLNNSLTHWLTHCYLVNLIDVTLACEGAYSKLLLLLLVLVMRIVLATVCCRYGSWGLFIKLNIRSPFVDKIWSSFWSWSSGKIWSWSLVSILLLMFCRG